MTPNALPLPPQRRWVRMTSNATTPQQLALVKNDGVARGSPPSDPLLCNDEPGASNESGQKPSSLEEIEDLNRRIDSQCQEGLEDILGDAGLVNDDAALENENYDLEAFLADLFIPELDTSAEQDAAPGEREASANDGSAAVWHDINPQE
jgi:hypothetical protein